jgi:hypothetical protein
MQGTVVMQLSVNGTTARLDVSGLANGMYMLVIRSPSSLKEKRLKFLVSK